MNRIKGIIYDLLTFFACSGARKRSRVNKVLIIRVDEIGDYLLWRKYIPEIINSSICNGNEIHFIGNSSWKSLFELEFTNTTFVKIYWLNKNLYKTSIKYRYQFSRCIYNENYNTVINPTYSRAKRVDDSIVKAAKANHNYGFVRNNENYLPYEQSYDKNLFDKLLPIYQKPVFEFFRNKEFTEWITHQASTVSNIGLFDTAILPEINTKFNLPDKYFVVFPGSRSAKRIWSAQNFCDVSDYLYEKYKITAILAGAPTDAIYGEEFLKNYNYPCLNLIGSTSLPEMLSLLKGSECLLSVDTGAIHLAATVNCLSFGIFNGSQYGRFSPYPSSLSNKIVSIYPTSIHSDINNENIVKEKYEHIVNVDYNQVTASQVIDTIKKSF